MTDLLSTLKEAREALQFANDSPGGAVSNTIWMMHRPETLFDFLDAAIASAESAIVLSTPAAAWRQAGEPDPHAGHYDCERAKLTMGHLTDDELANGAFMNYDQPLNVQGILAGTHASPIAWMTAVKDRIRWLSRALEHSIASRAALAAKLAELEWQEPVGDVIHADVLPGRDGAYRHELLCSFRLGMQTELYARPVPAEPARLTDEEIKGLEEMQSKTGRPSFFLMNPIKFAREVETAVLCKLGINDRPAGD